MMKLGFDVGGSNIGAGIVDEKNHIVARREVPFPLGSSGRDVALLMARLGKGVAGDAGVALSDLTAVGAAIPGRLDEKKERILYAHNLKLYDVPLREALSALFPGIPVFLGNDADTAALGELHAGIFRGCHTAVLLTLGTGVGGGLILGGKMFTGGLGHGVELGHMTLQLDGPLCTCENRGCVETLCSATWLIKEGRKAVGAHPKSRLAQSVLGEKDNVDAKKVIDAAKDGDEIAEEIFHRYVHQLSAAIVSCTNLLDPEVVGIGGGVSLAGAFLFDPLRKAVERKSFFRHPYLVLPTSLGNDAGILGAALLSLNQR